jgi:hypothetical protein
MRGRMFSTMPTGKYSTDDVIPAAVAVEFTTGTCCPIWMRAWRPSITSTEGFDRISASPFEISAESVAENWNEADGRLESNVTPNGCCASFESRWNVPSNLPLPPLNVMPRSLARLLLSSTTSAESTTWRAGTSIFSRSMLSSDCIASGCSWSYTMSRRCSGSPAVM